MLNHLHESFASWFSIDSLFPHVTLHFVGGATMHLKPKNYLRSVSSNPYSVELLSVTYLETDHKLHLQTCLPELEILFAER